MAPVPLQKPRKKGRILVDFAYGDPAARAHERLTNWTVDVTHTTGVYTSLPELDVRLSEINGTLDEKPVEIHLPLTNAFAERISDGRAHSRARVKIIEISEADGVTEELPLHVGRVSDAHRNYQGRAGTVMIESPSWKSYLDALEGISIDPTCSWTLGGAGCEVDMTQYTHTGILTQIDGPIVTIGGLPGVPTRYFHRGFVEKDGLRISIREWVSGTSFFLVRDPPGTWLNANVRVAAGCPKTLAVCRARFNREQRFAAWGYATPAYNPLMEVG